MPAALAAHRLEASERGADCVRRVADIDDDERIGFEHLKPARPTRRREAASRLASSLTVARCRAPSATRQRGVVALMRARAAAGSMRPRPACASEDARSARSRARAMRLDRRALRQRSSRRRTDVAPSGAASILSRAMSSSVSPSNAVCSRSSDVSARRRACDQPHRIEPSADARFPHRVRASPRGEPIGRDQKQKLKAAQLVGRPSALHGGAHARPMLLQLVVGDVLAVDAEALVQREQMRRGEEPDGCAGLPQGSTPSSPPSSPCRWSRQSPRRVSPKRCEIDAQLRARSRATRSSPGPAPNFGYGTRQIFICSAASKLARQIAIDQIPAAVIFERLDHRVGVHLDHSELAQIARRRNVEDIHAASPRPIAAAAASAISASGAGAPSRKSCAPPPAARLAGPSSVTQRARRRHVVERQQRARTIAGARLQQAGAP